MALKALADYDADETNSSVELNAKQRRLAKRARKRLSDAVASAELAWKGPPKVDLNPGAKKKQKTLDPREIEALEAAYHVSPPLCFPIKLTFY